MCYYWPHCHFSLWELYFSAVKKCQAINYSCNFLETSFSSLWMTWILLLTVVGSFTKHRRWTFLSSLLISVVFTHQCDFKIQWEYIRRGHQQFSLLHDDLSLPSVRHWQKEGIRFVSHNCGLFLRKAAGTAMLSGPAQRSPDLFFNVMWQVK